MYGMIIEDDDNNDFSDGTPHLAEIITAFDNHGIGPGIANFNGLPLTPEAWEELLGEEPPEGEEDPLMGAFSPYPSNSNGPCYTYGGTLYVRNGTCYVYGSASFTDVRVEDDGQLEVGNYSSYSNPTTLTITDDLWIEAGGKAYIGSGNINYDATINMTDGSGNGQTYLYNGSSSSSPGGILYVRSNTTTGVDNSIIGDAPMVINTWAKFTVADEAYSSTDGDVKVYGDGVIQVGDTGFCWPTPCTPPDLTGRLDINGTTYMRNGGTINVYPAGYFYTDGIENGDGSYTGGALTINGRNHNYGAVNLYDSGASIDNNNYFYSSGAVTIDGGADFDNSDRVFINNNITVDGGATVSNSSRFYQYSGHSTSIKGGATVTNTTTSSSDDMEFNSDISISGTLSTLQNDGGQLDINKGISISDSSRLWNDNGATALISDSVLMYGSAQVRNQTSSRMDIGSSSEDILLMRASTQFDNDGTVNVYDDIIMANEVSGATATINNNGNINAIFTSDNTFQITQGCTVNNNSGANIDLSTGSSISTDGVIQVFNNADLLNSGTITATQIQVGDFTSDGGSFYNKSGGSTTISNSGNALTIYKGLAENQAGASLLNMSSSGTIRVQGVSSDFAYFKDYEDSSGRLLVEGFSEATIYDGATHTGGECTVFEANDGTDGIIDVQSGATLDCTTINMGSSLNNPGTIEVHGELTGTDVYVYEDTSSLGSGPDDDYELDIHLGGYVHPTNLHLGDSTNNGGEVLNRAGDGVKAGTDTTNEGINADVYLYSSGELYNGEDRNQGVLNSSAEVNYEDSKTHSVVFERSGIFNNSGLVGGLSVETDETNTEIKQFFNRNGAEVTSDGVFLYQKGAFYNGDNSSTSGPTVDSIHIYILGNSGYYNYGDTTATSVAVGHASWPNGTLELKDRTTGSSTFEVTGTGSSLQISDGGVLEAESGAGSFTVANGGVAVGASSGSGDTAEMNIYDGTSTPYFGELFVTHNGTVSIAENTYVDDAGGATGDLIIVGLITEEGTVTIEHTENAILAVDGETEIRAYGILENNSNGGAGYGFEASELATVLADGTINSDISSDFYFLEGLTTAGTVTISDDALLEPNTSSGYALEVTGGTTTLGGGTVQTTPAGAGDVYISGGTFNSYSNFDIDGDLEVTGASTEANFEDDTMTANCETNVTGYFDITDEATATLACETEPGFIVQSNSPGGNTQVEGTLIVNSNIETETMVVGDGSSNGGVVTHDEVGCWGLNNTQCPNGWFPSNPNDVCVIDVLDTLTINSNGAIDVSEKSINREDYYDPGNGRGGSYGGKGQHINTADTDPYGNMASWLDDFGVMGFSNLSTTINYAGTSYTVNLGGAGGGLVNLTVGEDIDTVPDGILDTGQLNMYSGTADNEGGIFANGADYIEGGGSGGGINIKAYNIAQDGDIEATGGEAQSGYEDKTAGGGGRIYLEYFDKSDFTGDVKAIGGTNYNYNDTVRYDNETSNFSQYENITGGTSGATAQIIHVTDNGTAGYLELINVVGTFQDNETITGDKSPPGSAQVNGSPYSAVPEKYAGTGTIFYKWADKWRNQNDGTLVIDGWTTSDNIDVDLDGNTTSTDKDDATTSTQYLDIESLQLDRYGSMYFYKAPSGGGTLPASDAQQCIAANNGKLWLGGVAGIRYNRDHGQEVVIDCLETPDPPSELFINDATTGAQSGKPGFRTNGEVDYDNQTADFNVGATLTGQTVGTQGEIFSDDDNGTSGTLVLSNLTSTFLNAFQDNEIITDDGATPGSASVNGGLNQIRTYYLRPVVSAIHNDATLDRTTTTETPTHDVYEYQLIIGNTLDDVWNDNAITGCDIDSTRFPDDSDYADNTRTGDIQIPAACGSNLSAGNKYSWKIRFMEDLDDDYSTTNDQYWGLWSNTNYFRMEEGGLINVEECTPLAIGADTGLYLDPANIVYEDTAYCTIGVDSTTDFWITTTKDQTLTDSTTANTFPDIETTDTYLDGYKNFAGDQTAEFAFRVGNFLGITNNMTATVDLNQGANKTYDESTCDSSGGVGTDPCWHKLQTGSDATVTNNTIITSTSAALDATFRYYLGAYLPSPINDYSNTAAGDYETTIGVTLWSKP